MMKEHIPNNESIEKRKSNGKYVNDENVYKEQNRASTAIFHCNSK